MMPRELTAENGAKAALMGEFTISLPGYCPECDGEDDECALCHGSGEVVDHINVPWTTIKEIWRKAVEHFAGKEVSGG